MIQFFDAIPHKLNEEWNKNMHVHTYQKKLHLQKAIWLVFDQP